MNINWIFSTLVVVTISCFSSCFPTGASDCEKRYEFTIPISIYPAQDTFHVGDTIWIESSVNSMIINNLNGEEVDISTLRLKFDMAITAYNEDSHLFADHFFSYTNIVGGVFPGAVLTRIIYQDSSKESRKFKVGVIPTNTSTGKGTFYLTFGFLRPDYEEAELLNKNCLDLISFRYNSNEGRDNSSYNLLPNSVTQTITQAEFTKFGSFAFRVVP